MTTLSRRGLPLLLGACLLRPGTAPAMSPEVERLAEQGTEQLYELEFDRALATFAEIDRLAPDHPAGPALLAAATWWQARYWYRPTDDAASRRMEGWLADAEAKARRMVASPEAACEGRFFLGGVLGVRAHWRLLRHEYVAAALGARASVVVLRTLASCTPYGEEAWFGLGLYEYAAASLPWSMRWLSRFVIGGETDRAEALARLERAADRARWVRHDAQATLVVLCTVFSPDPARALPWGERLLRERPRSPMAHQLHAQALLFNRRWTETIAATDRALALGDAPDSTFALERSAFRYLRGMALLGQRHPREAEAEFARAVGAQGRPPWVCAATVKRGAALDLLGDRAGALGQYRLALTLPDPWRQHQRAKRYLGTAFTWADLDTELSPHGGYGPR